jgi:hypothetical protein
MVLLPSLLLLSHFSLCQAIRRHHQLASTERERDKIAKLEIRYLINCHSSSTRGKKKLLGMPNLCGQSKYNEKAFQGLDTRSESLYIDTENFGGVPNIPSSRAT